MRESGETMPVGVETRDLGRYLAVIPTSHADVGPCADCLVLWWNDRLLAAARPNAAAAPRLFPILEQRVSRTADRLNGTNRALVFDRLTAELSEHAVVVHPGCERCSTNQLTDPLQIPVALDEPGTLEGDAWRLRSIDTDELALALVEPTWGPIFGTLREENSEACLMRAPISLPGQGAFAAGYGRASSFKASTGPALVEALERLVSAAPLAPASRVVVASFDEFRVPALDARRLGTHDPRYQGHPNSLVEPFDRATVTSWIPAWSTLQREVLHVPSHAAYWRTHDGLPKFVYASSSGTATGSSIAEAVLYALFEVIERDAFLLTWHAQIPLPQVPWRHLPRAAELGESLLRRGMELRVLDATTEFGVAVSIAVITADETTVGLGANRALNVAAGAHFDRDIATMAAIDEAANNALMYASWSRRAPGHFAPTRFAPMLAYFAEVRVLEDHEGLFGLNEARLHWEFLVESPPVTDDGLKRSRPASASRNLPRTVQALIDRFHQFDMDVIIVNQSQLSMRTSHQLATVRVIVPELLAMTFGHVHSRVFESVRLENAHDSLLGALRPSRLLTQPVPHPFP